ncbi:MAG: glutamine synthetase [Rhodobacteraceae bacterium]|nr:glutamine synthetase [Paracoccaceae bacterium]
MKDDREKVDGEQGRLARLGLSDKARDQRAREIVDRLERDGIETVRVLFCDQHGILRGKTLVPEAFRAALDNGVMVPSTLMLKDTSHQTAFPVWSKNTGPGHGALQGASDLMLMPDPATFRVLPWSPHSAWILSDVVYPDGCDVNFSARSILRRAIERLADQEMAATLGLEVEFHIFEVQEDGRSHSSSTMPGTPVRTRNLTQGYQFLTEIRYAEAEPVLDEIRRAAQSIGLNVQSVEIEMGPSQFEFTFAPGEPLAQADAMVMFRTLVREVCAKRGLHASFMPKPRLENCAANGWHVHQSVTDPTTGRNLFSPDSPGQLTKTAQGWMAGLLHHAPAASLLLAPLVNSYKRYRPFQLAPNRIAWGWDNRGAMLRALMQTGDPAARIENRAPDSAANPYLAFAAQLIAGLDGIQSGLDLPAAEITPYHSEAKTLPSNLGEAIAAFEASNLFRDVLGAETADYLVTLKRFEWNRYLNEISEWEQREYFNLM